MSLTDWKYHKLITIANSNSTALTDYQIKIKLNNSNFDFSKANSDGSDIRFSEDGVNTIPYWIENWDNSGQTATIWVKVSKINANNNKAIRMYYGNSSATSESNGDNVFIFFDDFNGTSLDTTKWTTTVSGDGALDISGSIARLYAGAGMYEIKMNTDNYSLPSNFIVERWVKQGDYGGNVTRNRFRITGANLGFDYGIFSDGTTIQYYWNVNSGIAATLNTFGRMIEKLVGTDYYWDVYSGEYSNSASATITTPLGVENIVGESSNNKGGDIYLDWIFIHQYADAEPIVSIAPLINWKYYEKITIGHTKIDEDLTNFPVLVKLDSTNFDFSKAQSSGNDIRFTLKDGTLLSYERERHDSINQVAEYWVKIPFVSSTTDTIFYLYYGNSSASDGADPTNVWDNDYKMVQHMKDEPDTSHIKDSTLNGNNGTKKGAGEPAEVDGGIGKAQDFDGSDDYINTADISAIELADATFEFWVKINDLTKDNDIITKGEHTSNTPLIIWFDISVGTSADSGGGNTNAISVITYDGSTQFWLATPSNAINDTNWHHIVCVVNPTANELKIYIDGSLVTSYTKTWNGIQDTDTAIRLGDANPTSHPLDGAMDEVRISSNMVRSAAWIKASYNSENDTLVSYGVERANVNALFWGTNF